MSKEISTTQNFSQFFLLYMLNFFWHTGFIYSNTLLSATPFNAVSLWGSWSQKTIFAKNNSRECTYIFICHVIMTLFTVVSLSAQFSSNATRALNKVLLYCYTDKLVSTINTILHKWQTQVRNANRNVVHLALLLTRSRTLIIAVLKHTVVKSVYVNLGGIKHDNIVIKKKII